MFAYLRLLLKERLLLLNPMSGGKAGSSKAKTIWRFMGFALVFLMLYAMLVAFEYFVFQGFVLIGQPQGMLAVVFLICVLLTLILSFFYVFQALFFSRDIQVVSALPISSRGLLITKLIMIVLEEAAVALAICLPVLVMYGLRTNAGALLYVKMLLFVPFLPVLPIAIVTLLSFLLIRVSALWKRREGVTTVAAFLLVAGCVALQMSFSMSMNDAEVMDLAVQLVQRIQGGLVDMFARMFPPLQWICNGFLLEGVAGWLSGLLFSGVSLLTMGVVTGLLGGGYQALAVRQNEVVARLNARGRKARGKQGQRRPIMALYLQEMKEVFIVPAYATNCLATLVMFPIIAVVMMLGMGNMEGVPALVDLLAEVSRPIFLAIMAVFLCFTGTMNIAVSTAVSREGRRRYISKIIPVAAGTQLMAKLFMGLSFNGIATLLTAGVLIFFLPLFWAEILLGFAIAAVFSLLTCAASLILDAYHPRLDWKTETDAVKRNMNGMIGMFGGMLVLLLLVGVFFGCTALGASVPMAVGAVTLLMAAVDLLLMKWLRGKASVTYYLQEKFV